MSQHVKLLLAVLMGVALLAGCGTQEQGGQGQGKEERSQDSSQKKETTAPTRGSAQAKADTPKAKPKAPDPINLSGNGQAATQTFRLETGLVIARMNYQGERNFIVNALDGNGNLAGPALANVIGSFQGSYATRACYELG